MKISTILEENVKDNKGGNLGQVSEVIDILGLKQFAKIALEKHICCGLFKDNIRKLDNFQNIWFLQYDFDNGTDIKSVINIFSQYNMVILASKNHMVDKNDGRGIIPRFHLFLPLSTPITDYNFYSFLIKYLANENHIKIDRKAVDATRYFYKHTKLLYGKSTGKNLDWTIYKTNYECALLKEKEQNDVKENYLKIQNEKYNINFQERLEAAKLLIQKKVGYSISGNGGNNSTFVAACLCIRCGLNKSQINEVMEWYNINYCNPKWSKSGIENKIKYANKLVKFSDYFSPGYLLKIIGKMNATN